MDGARTERADELSPDVAWVRRLAAGLVGDRHLADDLAQEAWLVALRRPERFAAAPVGQRRAFLAGVLRHLAWKGRRGASRRAEHERAAASPGAGGPPGELIARAELARELVEHVLALDEPLRTALLLRYLDGLPPRAIARRLGVPVRTIASRLARGRERLRDALDRRPGGRETWLGGAVALAGAELTRGGGILGGALMGAKTSAAIAAGLVAATVLVAVRATDGDAELAGPEPELAAHGAAERGDDAELAAAGEVAERIPTQPAEPAAAEVDAGAGGRLVVRGRVIDGAYAELDLAEAPADGATVRVWASEEELPGPPGFTAPAGESTTRDGAFALELDDPGYRPVHLRVMAEGSRRSRSTHVSAVVPPGADAVEDVVLFRAPHGVLHGVVRDGAGAPLAGAAVSAKDPVERGRRIETRTDDRGAFALAPGGFPYDLVAALPGFALTAQPKVEMLMEGGFADVELELIAAGRLHVRVVDADGRPAPGRELTLRLAPEESGPGASRRPPAPPAGGFSMTAAVQPAGGSPVSATRPVGPAPAKSATTDDLGIAAFADAWIGRKVELTLRADRSSAAYLRHADGRLLGEGEEGGVALVIPAGGALELELVLPRDVLVRGAVVLPDGAAVPAPAFEVMTRAEEWQDPHGIAAGQGDDRGRFEARFPADRVESELYVVAVDGTLGGGWGAQPRFDHAARVALDLAGARAKDGGLVLDATCVLAPTASIAGRLVDEEGAPLDQGFGNRVYAVPAGAGHPFETTALGRPATARVDQGAFRIVGLPAGVYDVYATSEVENTFYSFSSGMVRVPDVAAGTTGLEIVVPRIGGVRVKVELETPGSEPPDAMTILVGGMQPFDGRTPPPGSPEVIRSGGLASWPESALWNFTGVGGARTPAGRFQYGLYGADEVAGHEVHDLGEGWYVFGVVPRRDGGISHFPVGTAPVYLRPGEHVVRFALTPVGPLEGRVIAGGPVGHLSAALVDAEGTLLPQLGSSAGLFRSMTRAVSLSAAGTFRFAVAPLGTQRLRIGTRAELARGAFQREVEVQVLPAEDAVPVEIRL